MKVCKTCRHWKGGECRRYPPHTSPMGRPVFPYTPEDAWCGEHAGKPGRRPKDGDGK